MKVSKLFLGLLFPLFISSCLNLDFEPTFYGDAIIVSRIFEGDTVYTIDGVVQANVVMDTAYLTMGAYSNLVICHRNTPQNQLKLGVIPSELIWKMEQHTM